MTPSGNLKTAVFLDRDGVIIRAKVRDGKPFSPRTFKEFAILPGVQNAISELLQMNLVIVVVTNQPDISNGFISREFVDETHSNLKRVLGLEHFYVCTHSEKDDCECRKPKTGLLKKAAMDLSLDLSNSYLVGDRWKDIQAGQDAGCTCYFIDYQYSERRPRLPFHTVSSLSEATQKLLEAIHGR